MNLCEYEVRNGAPVCRHCLRQGPSATAKRTCPRVPSRTSATPRPVPVSEMAENRAKFKSDPVTVALKTAVKSSRLPLGDAVASVAKGIGADHLARWYEEWTGKDCGCATRQEWLNAVGEWMANKVAPKPAPVAKAKPPSPTLVTLNTTPRVAAVPKPRLRVAFLTPTLGNGGAERWIVSLCKEWARRGNVVPAGVALVPGSETNEGLCGELVRAGVPIWGTDQLHPDQPNSTKHVERFADHSEPLRRVAQSADVLVHWGIPGIQSLLSGIGFRGPVVSVAHGSGDYTRQHTTMAQAGSTHFAAVSEAAALGQPADRQAETKVIWNGIEFDRLAPTADRGFLRSEFGWADDEIVVAHVGRLSPEKRPLAPFEAAVARPAIGWGPWRKRLRPVLVGDGWKREETLAGARKLWGTAEWIAPPAHLGDVLAALDVFVLASPAEGMSLAVAEAWAAGVPVVATRVGAVPELEERFGKLVEPVAVGASGTEIAAAVARAVARRNRATVERARRVAWEHLGAARMAHEWARWLRDIAR